MVYLLTVQRLPVPCHIHVIIRCHRLTVIFHVHMSTDVPTWCVYLLTWQEGSNVWLKSSMFEYCCAVLLQYYSCFSTEYTSKSPHSPKRPWHPVSHLFSTISSNYTSHHELSVLQHSNFSKYHICLQVLVGAPSATALLQHGIPFLLPLKIARSYIVSSAIESFIS